MPLVTTKEMFKKAYEGGYAIGAFNVNNMETVQGIVEAAKETSAPLILQVKLRAPANMPSIHILCTLFRPPLKIRDFPSRSILTTATASSCARVALTEGLPLL